MLSHNIPLSYLVGAVFLIVGMFTMGLILDSVAFERWRADEWWERWNWELIIAFSGGCLSLFCGVLLFFRNNTMRIFLVALLHISMAITAVAMLIGATTQSYYNRNFLIEGVLMIIGFFSPQVFLLFFFTQTRFMEEFKGAEEKERDDLLDFY